MRGPRGLQVLEGSKTARYRNQKSRSEGEIEDAAMVREKLQNGLHTFTLSHSLLLDKGPIGMSAALTCGGFFVGIPLLVPLPVVLAEEDEALVADTASVPLCVNRCPMPAVDLATVLVCALRSE